MDLRSKVAKKASRIVAQEVEEDLHEELETTEEEQAEEALEDEPVEDVEETPVEEAAPSLEEKLDKLTQTLTTLVDAIADQKKVIEESLSGKAPAKKDLEDVQEEELPEGKEEVLSPEEFGVDVDNLVTGDKEMSLRSARKDRLAAKEKGPETVSEAFAEEKGKDLKLDAPAPTITKVKKSELPEMLKLAEVALELSEDKSKWTVLKVAGETETPVYEILASDVKDEGFATEAFAHKLIAEMKDLGVEETLNKIGAKNLSKVEVAEPEDMFKLEEDRSKKTKKASEKVAEEVKEEPVVKAAVEEEVVEPVNEKIVASNHKRKFSKAFKLANVAMNKNLIDNPLKAALFDTLSKFDLDASDCTKIIEVAFAKAADEQFDVAMKETDKFMNLTDEAFLEAESLIGDMNIRTVDVDDVEIEASARSVKARELSKRAEKSSLILSTASDSDASDKSTLIGLALPKPANWGRKG